MTPVNALPPQHLEVSGLTVSRGGRRLFDRLDFRLGHWETLLLRGPNGAGKTSLLLAVAGILRPDAGTLDWVGVETPSLHVLGHESGVKPRLTLAEHLRFWRAVNGATGLDPAAALAAVGLGGLGDIAAGHLSAGQTRRLALARLLVSRRDVWLLDEPTAALDAAGLDLVARLLLEHQAAGGGAIVATHDPLPLPAARTLALEPQ